MPFAADGGAIAAGMRFIYVKPVSGNEKPFHRATRYFGYLCARMYSPENFSGKALCILRL